MKEIQKTTLRDITKNVRIYYDPNPTSTDTAVQEDAEILRAYERFSVGQGCASSAWIMRLELNAFEMAARNVMDMTLIQTKIQNNKVLKVFECIHSDTNSGKLIMRIMFGSDVAKNALSLRFIEDKLLDTVLTGVDGIGRVYPRELGKELIYDPLVGGYTSKKQYVLDVEGTNLLDLALMDGTDPYRTFSNEIHEIMEVFGIETARIAMYEEFMEVFTTEYVNYHHMITLIDAMTFPGYILSADRFGMNKNDSGVLAKSSFEETSKILFNAALSAEKDNMKGVSANIMFGQPMRIGGTGSVDILIDETRLPEGDVLETLPSFPENADASAETNASTVCNLADVMMEW
jgi:DNA-directed RNA polymerase II subunit RPB1